MAVSVYANNKLATAKPNESWTKLLELVPDGSRVLDVGCSSGNFGSELTKRKDCEVTGLDINEADLAIAKKHLKGAYNRNIEHDAIDDLGEFDIIVMADVIEHLIDPVSALKKLRKQLSKGGRIVFSVPNMANFATRLELLAGRFTYTEFGLLDETHLHYYDRIELENVLAKSDLRVLEYNNTIRDVPERAATKLLADMGLKPSEDFWKLARHIDSVTFQFIGVASKDKGSHNAVATQTPHDFVSQMFDDMIASHQQKEVDIQAKLTELTQEITSAKKELGLRDATVHRLEQELQTIYNSKAWSLISRARNIRRKLKI